MEETRFHLIKNIYIYIERNCRAFEISSGRQYGHRVFERRPLYTFSIRREHFKRCIIACAGAHHFSIDISISVDSVLS